MKRFIISMVALVGLVSISHSDYPWTTWYNQNPSVPGNLWIQTNVKFSGKLYGGAGGLFGDGTSKITMDANNGVILSTKGFTTENTVKAKNIIVTSTSTLVGNVAMTGTLSVTSTINGLTVSGTSYEAIIRPNTGGYDDLVLMGSGDSRSCLQLGDNPINRNGYGIYITTHVYFTNPSDTVRSTYNVTTGNLEIKGSVTCSQVIAPVIYSTPSIYALFEDTTMVNTVGLDSGNRFPQDFTPKAWYLNADAAGTASITLSTGVVSYSAHTVTWGNPFVTLSLTGVAASSGTISANFGTMKAGYLYRFVCTAATTCKILRASVEGWVRNN
jgi:hypothetical protein